VQFGWFIAAIVQVERSFSAFKMDAVRKCWDLLQCQSGALSRLQHNTAHLLISSPYSRSHLSGAVACLLLVLFTLALSPLPSLLFRAHHVSIPLLVRLDTFHKNQYSAPTHPSSSCHHSPSKWDRPMVSCEIYTTTKLTSLRVPRWLAHIY
jgi:hypothetical protein